MLPVIRLLIAAILLEAAGLLVIAVLREAAGLLLVIAVLLEAAGLLIIAALLSVCIVADAVKESRTGDLRIGRHIYGSNTAVYCNQKIPGNEGEIQYEKTNPISHSHADARKLPGSVRLRQPARHDP